VSLYVLVSDHGEGRLADYIDRTGTFTDGRPSQPKLATRQVALISFEGDAVNAVGRMTRGRKVASLRWGLRVDEIVVLDDPLPLETLLEALPEAVRGTVRVAFARQGAQLEDNLAPVVLDTIAELEPWLEDDLAHLRRISAPLQPRPRVARGEPIVAFERDAVGLALEMAGLEGERQAALSAWDGTEDEPFIAGVPTFTALEDRAIEHDAQVFGDWELIKRSAVGMARFESRGRRVTVINVNRAGIEKAIGVDLIYYTQKYDAYVLVQYKRRDNDSDERWVYRPDSQFDGQLERMRGLVEDDSEPSLPHQYRLDERCCFLKFCVPTLPQAFTPGLIKGAYLPLAYWDCLAGSGVLRGTRGGRVITGKTADRYLNNSQFIDLVQSSWVGSRGATSEQIGQIVRAGVESNESLILAHAADD
jgi:hypothetical protein